MRKFLLSILLCGAAMVAQAQQLYTPSGSVGSTSNGTTNVGIGTSSPTEKLHVNGNIRFPIEGMVGLLPSTDKFSYDGKFVGNFSLGWFNDTWQPTSSGPTGYMSGYSGIKFFTNTKARMVITKLGNVGIGIENPVSTKLEVDGSVTIGSGHVNANTTKLFINNPYAAGNNWAISSGANNVAQSHFAIYNWTAEGGKTTPVPSFFIHSNGNVGIGNVDPKTYKLAVTGKIIAEEVIVALQTAWPDYVFEAGYDLQPLNEVADFVQKNKHLPGVPSAVEVAENGVQLGDMSATLLKKIEELTLYILEQEKKMAEQDKRIAGLEKKNKKK